MRLSTELAKKILNMNPSGLVDQSIADRQFEFVQFYRTLAHNIKRVFAHLVVSCSNQFRNTEVFCECLRFLRSSSMW